MGGFSLVPRSEGDGGHLVVEAGMGVARGSAAGQLLEGSDGGMGLIWPIGHFLDVVPRGACDLGWGHRASWLPGRALGGGVLPGEQ